MIPEAFKSTHKLPPKHHDVNYPTQNPWGENRKIPTFSDLHHRLHHDYVYIWVFPKIRVPQNGWFIMENLIKMDDLGGNTPIFGNIHI